MRLPFRLKMTLTKRIWMSFALLIALIGVLMSVVYPFMIKSALREDSFDTIEYVQSTLYQGQGSYGFGHSTTEMNKQRAAKSVGNLFVDSDFHQTEGNLIKEKGIYQPMVHEMMRQKSVSGRYELQYQGSTLYYVISKVNTNLGPGYFISYMWDTYPKELMHKLWTRMIYIFIVIGVLSLFIAFGLARYLKKPLDILGRRFEEIAGMNWEKPFEWKGDEEFERLSSQFEKMRVNLIKYDHSQKVFLQQASHELKTPIMVIHSYAQSMKDHIYPKGNLNDSIDVVIHESERMEERVKKLLYFTRYDSLNEQKPNHELIRFGDLAVRIRERLIAQRKEVSIHIDGDETILWGDREQLQTVLENLLENSLRYAESRIWMTAKKQGEVTVMTVGNDGNRIPEKEGEGIFLPFEKGVKGQFGLGLAIVRRIVQAHSGSIKAINLPKGVNFQVTLPAPPKDLLLEGSES